MASNAEASVRRTDTYFAREVLDSNANPQTPADPQFRLYSSAVETTEHEPSAEFDERMGTGNYIAHKKNRQQETNELTVSYDLERIPIDSSGNAVDAYADASSRDIDGRVANTHSFLEIEKKAEIIPESTIHHRYFTDLGNSHPSGSDPGATKRPTRFEHYGRGCVPAESSMEIAPEDSSVLGCEIQYNVTKYRRYQIDQPPDGGASVAIKSTASEDTTGDVELESVDGATSEALTVNGTTLVPSTNSYSSLRVALSEEMTGDIEVYQYDSSTSTAGQLLTVIRGKNSRDGIEGDLGVPLVGSGSFESEDVLNSGVPALGTNLEWGGNAAAENVVSSTVTAENEVEESATDDGVTLDLRAGGLTLSVESTMFGESETPQKFDDYLLGREGELRYHMQGFDLVIPRGYINDGGSLEREEGSAVLQSEVTWNVLEPADGSDPLQFVRTS